jgi:hypothetical protein
MVETNNSHGQECSNNFSDKELEEAIGSPEMEGAGKELKQ